MLLKLLLALSLMAGCVVIHASGITWSLSPMERAADSSGSFWRSTWLCIRLAVRMIVCHLVEISIWGLFYLWNAAMRDLPSALYFSAVTYTTTGYGDLILPPEWRLVGGVEALTGILMCGWSTAFFFAVVSRLHTTDTPEARRL